MKTLKLTAVIERDGALYVAHCPQVDVASQGATPQEARKNLTEAVELFFESADEQEIATRVSMDMLIEPLEVTVG